MNPGCTVLKISSVLLFLFFFLLSAAQPDLSSAGFYAHLTRNNLLNEKLVLNQRLQKKYAADSALCDSLKLSLAGIYLQLHVPDSSRQTLLAISHPGNFSDNTYQLYLSLLVVNGQTDLAERRNQSRKHTASSFSATTALGITILKRKVCPTDSLSKFSISPALLDIQQRYEKTPRHSPLLSGVYSMLLPGLGKAYIGYPLQGLTSFAVNALLAAQTIESYSKAGAASSRFVLSAGAFAAFYIGNIWGSMILAKKKKKDYLKQLDHEILDYHHAVVRTQLF